MTSTHKTPKGKIPKVERSHEENPWLYWHQHRIHYGQNSNGRIACTRRKSLTLMTLTQKTLWAEFLWAKRLFKKKNPWLSWHQHRRLHGQNSYGRTLTWRKKHGPDDINTEDSMSKNLYGRNACTRRQSLTLMTLTQKTLWAEFLWMKRLFKKKNPWLSWHQHRLHGQNFLWVNAHMKKILDSYNANTEDTMGRIPTGETLAQDKNSWLSWHQHRRLHGQNSYGRMLTWRKNMAPPMLTQKTP